MGIIETVEGLSHDIPLVKTAGWMRLRQRKRSDAPRNIQYLYMYNISQSKVIIHMYILSMVHYVLLPTYKEKQYVNNPPVLSIEGIERLWHFSIAENMWELSPIPNSIACF